MTGERLTIKLAEGKTWTLHEPPPEPGQPSQAWWGWLGDKAVWVIERYEPRAVRFFPVTSISWYEHAKASPLVAD